MKVRIEIDCKNNAFTPPGRMRELKRILQEAKNHIPELWLAVKKTSFPLAKGLMDINGNRVGSVSVEP